MVVIHYLKPMLYRSLLSGFSIITCISSVRSVDECRMMIHNHGVYSWNLQILIRTTLIRRALRDIANGPNEHICDQKGAEELLCELKT